MKVTGAPAMAVWSLGCWLMTGGERMVSIAFELVTEPRAFDTRTAYWPEPPNSRFVRHSTEAVAPGISAPSSFHW